MEIADQGRAGRVFADELTFGERLADKVASFGGSWTFILLFAALLCLWTGANTYVLHQPFDPYPYICLNLLLSIPDITGGLEVNATSSGSAFC